MQSNHQFITDKQPHLLHLYVISKQCPFHSKVHQELPILAINMLQIVLLYLLPLNFSELSLNLPLLAVPPLPPLHWLFPLLVLIKKTHGSPPLVNDPSLLPCKIEPPLSPLVPPLPLPPTLLPQHSPLSPNKIWEISVKRT